ncbi:hypothetical protein SLEP1_g59769 [Rubroshorea leprosula]|uniref:Uncharacterized protein n=1 Tax=Rubroshorea leprosula TaxID=152421 RepID=A0AAV5MTA9_9ROSI|nr:hypothetical protein SLEP1_g59769 [Rubroshorea leprosula]
MKGNYIRQLSSLCLLYDLRVLTCARNQTRGGCLMGRRPLLRTLPSWVLLIRKLPGKMLTLPGPLSSSSRPSSKNGSPPRR